jgi:hypothetical protein
MMQRPGPVRQAQGVWSRRGASWTRLDVMRPCPEFLAHGSAVLGALVVFFVTAVGVAGDGTDVVRTWEEARIFLPGSAVPFKPSKVPATHRQLTTVLYLHGCTGFDYSHDGTMGGWAETLTAAGYAVVMPTSFAREYRPRNCDQATYTSGLAWEVMDMRLEEIEYALKQLRTLSWVDQRNLFLIRAIGGCAHQCNQLPESTDKRKLIVNLRP